jgi:carbon monoxide dehydrogenase subunit G
MPSLSITGLFHDKPRDNRPAFGKRDADEHERQNFAKHSGIARHGGNAAGGGDADADSRAAKGETDVDVALKLQEQLYLLTS